MKSINHLRAEIMTPENAWTVAGFLAVVLGAATGRALLKSGWRTATGSEPPLNPESDETDWRSALVWAVVTGALVGIVRTVSRKGASSIRRRWS